MTKAAAKRLTTAVLAAGDGKRIGGPKALLAWPSVSGEAPLVIAHAEARLAADTRRVLVVTRPSILGALLAYVRPGIDLVASEQPDELGPAGSLACAAARLEPDDALVLVTPVDTPPASAPVVARLLARLDADPALLAVRPSYGGRFGHPVLVRAAVLARYLAPDPPPLRDHLAALGAACAGEPVADPNVLADLDRPADVMGLLGSMPRFLR